MADRERDGWPAFVHELVAETLHRAVRTVAITGLVFVVAAWVANGIWLGHGWWRLVGLLLLPLAALLGAAAGAALAVTSTLRRALDASEARLNAVLQPVTTRLIESTRLGRSGIPIERFEQILEAEIARLELAPPGRRGSPARVAFRFVGRSVLRLVRRLFVREFLGELRRQGQTQVTPAAVEAFVREKLTGMLADRFRAQVNVVHGAVVIVSAALVAAPIVYLIVQR